MSDTENKEKTLLGISFLYKEEGSDEPKEVIVKVFENPITISEMARAYNIVKRFFEGEVK